jgi:hypothetical protein
MDLKVRKDLICSSAYELPLGYSSNAMGEKKSQRRFVFGPLPVHDKLNSLADWLGLSGGFVYLWNYSDSCRRRRPSSNMIRRLG